MRRQLLPNGVSLTYLWNSLSKIFTNHPAFLPKIGQKLQFGRHKLPKTRLFDLHQTYKFPVSAPPNPLPSPKRLPENTSANEAETPLCLISPHPAAPANLVKVGMRRSRAALFHFYLNQHCRIGNCVPHRRNSFATFSGSLLAAAKGYLKTPNAKTELAAIAKPDKPSQPVRFDLRIRSSVYCAAGVGVPLRR